MKAKLRAIVGLVLATTLFTSAAPATLSLHYCGGELMDASFTERFEPCCSVEESTSSEPTMEATTCEFDQFSFESYDDGLSLPSITISPVFIDAPHFSELSLSIEIAPTLHCVETRGPPQQSGVELCIRYERYLL
ncbi:MAG: hypothetical protein HWD92_09060 [Flavobacteriia bacterium]|nr:hypothetical protein [Flavobacteriia bacterium]